MITSMRRRESVNESIEINKKLVSALKAKLSIIDQYEM